MANERLAANLQEDVLTLLSYSDEHGRIIRNLITPELFEGDFRNIAERAIQFWDKHNSPPKQHIADLFADILENKLDRRGNTYRRILVAMNEVHAQINVPYILSSLNEFTRVQKAKAVLLKSSEELYSRGINGLQEVETLLHNFLRDGITINDPGVRLSDIDRVLNYFQNVHTEFKTGVRELDSRNIVPMRGKIFFVIAPPGFGKTWALICIGKMAFALRKKVCHISLEIEAEEVAQRYYQALFGVSKRDDINKISTMKFDRNGILEDIASATVTPEFSFASSAIRDELQVRINHFGTRAGNILIKRFPMRSLTIQQLEAYLESLEAVEKFTPDLVIIDYPAIMKVNDKDFRISLGRLVEELRGVAQRRNFALAVAHQVNRTGSDADMAQLKHIAEDWSIGGTADFVITYSQTAAEKQFGLARLYVAKARSEEDKFGVLITQSYKTGQFVLESTRLSDAYVRLAERMRKDPHDDEDGTSKDD